MVARGFWTLVLALLAWLPLGREQMARRAQRGERSLFAASALDVASESAVRGRTSTTSLLALPPRPTPARGIVPAPLAIGASRVAMEVALAAHGRAAIAPPWRPRAKRLTIPHDATAPPLSLS